MIMLHNIIIIIIKINNININDIISINNISINYLKIKFNI